MINVPTEPGWYWWRYHLNPKWEPVEVWATEDKRLVCTLWTGSIWGVEKVAERGIFGPRIPEPEGEQK